MSIMAVSADNPPTGKLKNKRGSNTLSRIKGCNVAEALGHPCKIIKRLHLTLRLVKRQQKMVMFI
jgi:hypothetical protein